MVGTRTSGQPPIAVNFMDVVGQKRHGSRATAQKNNKKARTQDVGGRDEDKAKRSATPSHPLEDKKKSAIPPVADGSQDWGSYPEDKQSGPTRNLSLAEWKQVQQLKAVRRWVGNDEYIVSDKIVFDPIDKMFTIYWDTDDGRNGIAPSNWYVKDLNQDLFKRQLYFWKAKSTKFTNQW
jgi:hypothetical protein